MSGWNEVEGKLVKELVFKNFIEAFEFMKQVAVIAEDQQHHPEWFNVYNKVIIALSTHDAGDVVTEKDHKLAVAIDRLLELPAAD